MLCQNVGVEENSFRGEYGETDPSASSISSIRVLFQVVSCGVPSLPITAPRVCFRLRLDSVGSGLS